MSYQCISCHISVFHVISVHFMSYQCICAQLTYNKLKCWIHGSIRVRPPYVYPVYNCHVRHKGSGQAVKARNTIMHNGIYHVRHKASGQAYNSLYTTVCQAQDQRSEIISEIFCQSMIIHVGSTAICSP